MSDYGGYESFTMQELFPPFTCTVIKGNAYLRFCHFCNKVTSQFADSEVSHTVYYSCSVCHHQLLHIKPCRYPTRSVYK